MIRILLTLAFLLLAGCSAPANRGACEAVEMSPLDETIAAGQTLLALTIIVTNCGDAPRELDQGACSENLLPRLTHGNDTWTIRNGAALLDVPCESEAPPAVQLPARQSIVLNAKWNGQVEGPLGTFTNAAPGVYATSVTAFGETVRGNVTVSA